MKRISLDERVVDKLINAQKSEVDDAALPTTKEKLDEFIEYSFEYNKEMGITPSEKEVIDHVAEQVEYDESLDLSEEHYNALAKYVQEYLKRNDRTVHLPIEKTSSFTPEKELSGEAETPWSFNKDKGEIGRKSQDKEFLTIEEVDDICPSCAKRMHAKGITKVSAKAFAKQLKERKGQTEEEPMGDVWNFSDQERDAASDRLGEMIQTARSNNDPSLRNYLEKILGDKWETILNHVDTEGSVWVVWWEDGISKFIEDQKGK
jgi:hypothetical protein